MNIPFFVFSLSSINGHLDYSHNLATVNSAAINICVQVLFEHLFSILWGISLGVEWLGHRVTPDLTY